ncbi:MAG: CpaF family protein [Lachnospiraceae bacterium]|nr:CpaF family protein [Lachnospiraceae bacterium]
MHEDKKIVSQIKQKIMSDMKFAEELSEEELKDLISMYLLEKEESYSLTLSQRKQMGKEIFDALRKYDILQDLLDDEEITEIMVNGPEHIFVEKKGAIERVKQQFESTEMLLQVINQIVSSCNRTVNEAMPIVDARIFGSGARVNVVLAPIALNGPILTIRRFPSQPITMEKLKEIGAITEEAIVFLQKAVKAKYNILISGGTGSGKTTFLNALSQYIPSDERIITIEDSAELQILGIENLIRMETRNVYVEGGKLISIRDLIKTSLRMRPNRIIVGEVRGEEALDMIGSAMNCGHDGSMSSAHANSAKDMLIRLENMILMSAEIPVSAIRRQIASGIDLIIHLGRLRDKSRKVLEIVEVKGIEDEQIMLNPIFRFQENKETKKDKVEGSLVKVGTLIHTYKMESAGLEFEE